jgi:hyperosmotically inducible protein
MHIKKIGLATLLAVVALATTVVGCSSNEPMPAQKAGTFVDDSYLTSAIKTKLLATPGINSFDLHVVTKDQVVTLSGTVPTDALRDQAIAVVKTVDGVKDVVSDIEVKSSP